MQGWADRVAGYFVPVVVVLGFGVFLLWLILTHLDCFPQEMYPPGSNGLLVALLFAISVIVIGAYFLITLPRIDILMPLELSQLVPVRSVWPRPQPSWSEQA